MEPNDLKSPAPDDTPLEAWLRAGSLQPPLSDDGFSARVLTALPPPKRRIPPRLIVGVAGALAGLFVEAQPFLSGGTPLDRLPALDAALVQAFEPLAHPAIGLAIGVTLGTLVYVFWRDLRRFVRL